MKRPDSILANLYYQKVPKLPKYQNKGEVTYTHEPGKRGAYRLQRTVSPYTRNRDIKRFTEAPTDPRQVNFLQNYAGAMRGYQDDPGFNYPTQVPFEGDKHWNIDRFIIDPQFGGRTGSLHTTESTAEQNRANVLSDMYKYYMLQDPEHKGKAFRKAKRFVRREIDPKIKGPFLQSYNNKADYFQQGYQGVQNFADQNPLKDLYFREVAGSGNVTPEEIEKLKDVSMDYFRNYKKMSRRESKDQWNKWNQEATTAKEKNVYSLGGGPGDDVVANEAKAKEFLRNWYTGRAELPQFKDLATARLKTLNDLNYKFASGSDNKANDQIAYYPPTGGKTAYLTDPNDPNYNANGLGILPEVIAHEYQHALDYNNPQYNRGFFRPVPAKVAGLEPSMRNWMMGMQRVKNIDEKGKPLSWWRSASGYDLGNPDRVRTQNNPEAAGVITMFRMSEGIDPKQVWNEKNIMPYINKYSNKKYINDHTKESYTPYLIQTWMKQFGNNPKVIADMLNKYVKNESKQTLDMARYGGLELQKAQHGLSFEQITGIKPITSLTNSGESTSLGTKIDEAAIRQAQIDKARERQGSIRKAEPKRSAVSKAWAIATHPMTALSYKAKGQDIPEHFDRGERNAYETAVDIVNPFSYIDQARQVKEDIGQGNYLAAGIGALGLIPGEGAIERSAGKFLNKEKKPINDLLHLESLPEKFRGPNAYKIKSGDSWIGDFDLEKDGDKWVIGNVGLGNEYRGKGLGKESFIKANELIKNKGEGVLHSSGNFYGEDAKNVWRSLVKEGKAEQIGNDAWRFKTKTTSLTGTPKQSSLFGSSEMFTNPRQYFTKPSAGPTYTPNYENISKALSQGRDPFAETLSFGTYTPAPRVLDWKKIGQTAAGVGIGSGLVSGALNQKKEGGSMTSRFDDRGDISIPDLNADKWLMKYQTAGQVIPGVTDFKMTSPASESTAIRFNTPTGPVSTATTGQSKQAMAASTADMGKAKKAERDAEAQRVAERKAAKAFREGKVKTFTFPTGETKSLDDMNFRERQYIAGKSLEGRGRINEDKEAWYDMLNPISLVTSMAGALSTAPYEAKQSNSNLPYVSAIVNPLLAGRLAGSGSINPLSKNFWTNEVSNGEFLNNLAGGIPKSTVRGLGYGMYRVGRHFPDALGDHIMGLGHGMVDLTHGRKFFETFPITNAQRAKMILRQDKAFNKGNDFIQDWFYPNAENELRPEVEQRITDIEPRLKKWNSGLEYNSSNNPMVNTTKVITSSRTKDVLNNPLLTEEEKKYILLSRGKIAGVNTYDPAIGKGKSITLRNAGLYYHTPRSIRNTANHEYAHSSQRLGSFPWRDVITSKTPDDIYYEANLNTPIGKEFKDAMIDATPNKYTWEASPDELHSELMTARQNAVNEIVNNYGYTREEALDYLQDPGPAWTDYLIEVGKLNRFFKPGTTQEVKRKLIKALPAVIGGIGAGEALEQKKDGGNIKLGQNMTVTTEQLEELKRQGYKIQML